MKATDISFTEVVGSFRHDQVRMYASRDEEGEIKEVAVYDTLSSLALTDDQWTDSETEIFPILTAVRLFDGFRHVYFLGEEDHDLGYFNYQRMDVMAEICTKLHELGPIE